MKSFLKILFFALILFGLSFFSPNSASAECGRLAIGNIGGVCVTTDGTVASTTYDHMTGSNGYAVYKDKTGVPTCWNNGSIPASGYLQDEINNNGGQDDCLFNAGNGDYTLLQLHFADCGVSTSYATCVANNTGDMGAGVQTPDYYSQTADFTITSGGPWVFASTITWNNPTSSATLAGYPTHLNFDIWTNMPYCGYLTGHANGSTGATEGSCFPIGTTTYNYFTPGTAVTGTIYANIEIQAGDPLGEIVSSSISFTVGSTISLPTGQGIGPIFPIPLGNIGTSTSPFYVDCSAYEISLFSSSTLQGIGCVIKKTGLELAQGLFEPSTSTLAGYQQISFETKLPFAYFYSLKDAIESANTSSTNSFPSLSVKVPSFRGNATTSFVVFSTSTITNYVGTDFVTTFRAFLVFVLWFLFLGAVYFKARTIANPTPPT